MWQQRRDSILEWFRAEPKKRGRSRHSWPFLTESRNSINTPTYRPFPLSLSIYFCSTPQLLERGLFFTQDRELGGKAALWGGLMICLHAWTSFFFVTIWPTTVKMIQINSISRRFNRAIHCGWLPAYLPQSNPEGRALAPYGQTVWLQSARSFCQVSCRRSDSTGGLSMAAVPLITDAERPWSSATISTVCLPLFTSLKNQLDNKEILLPEG